MEMECGMSLIRANDYYLTDREEKNQEPKCQEPKKENQIGKNKRKKISNSKCSLFNRSHLIFFI